MGNCEQCIVRKLSSLKALSKEELVKMADCKTSYTIKKGEHIFEEGESINGIYCIKDGICKLTKLSSNGKDHIVKLVRKGELLGQRSMISEESANLSAVALEDMKVCYIPKQEVVGFFEKNNEFSMNVMKTICSNLRDSDEIIVNMAQKNMKSRLAHVLIYIHDTFGVDDSDDSLHLVLSREEYASMIGTATESCIRILSEFNKNGLIKLNGKKIVIKDYNQLKRIAE